MRISLLGGMLLSVWAAGCATKTTTTDNASSPTSFEDGFESGGGSADDDNDAPEQGVDASIRLRDPQLPTALTRDAEAP